MSDRQALFDRLIAYLDTKPDLDDYLDQPPQGGEAFDPYQMVAEWIALKQEVKQQTRLLHAEHESLQQALAEAQSHNAELIDKIETDATGEKALLKDLLPIMDTLDQACEYWRSQIESLPIQPQRFWQKWLPNSDGAALKAVFLSNQQGMEVMRRSLLELLQQRKITPIAALGQPFDPSCMYAIAQQSSNAPANTVIQEVVRGYRWQDQILREAQVIVAAN
jgi:molecular chaperone GrpE